MNSGEGQILPLAQSLTPREEEVLAGIGAGRTNRQIAGDMTIALSTVKWYVRQIYNKLGVDDRQAAIIRARKLGLLAEEQQIRHNLPLAPTPFVGREQELADLATLLADPDVRLITVTGPGGIGKTRLALEAARQEVRLQSSFSDGVFFVSLAPLESAAEIPAALAAALGFQFEDSGARSETQQLIDYLRQKQMLLVMDNFEHILEGQTLLASINALAARVTFLVTSRERLQMRGEQLFLLGGLEMAGSEEAPAAQLFLHIARRVAPDFRLLEGDIGQLLSICRLVEGMPLGLELAASWAGLLPLSGIADEIRESIDLLVSEHQDVPRRHQSMQATLDVSWRRQAAEQQHVFQALTVFRGGFTRAAALVVAGATLPQLVILANKSWLVYDRQRDRYHIHELLRQYGAGKLSADPAWEQDVRAKHSAYFCTFLQEREGSWFGPRQLDAAAEVRDEIDNIQRAWRWATTRGYCALLAQGLTSLCRFFFWEGKKSEGQKACRAVQEGLSSIFAGHKAFDEQCLATVVRALAWESSFATEMARREELLTKGQQLLDRAAQTGGDFSDEQALINLQRAQASGNKDYESAIELGMVALKSYRDIGDLHGQAEALSTLGVNQLFLGHFEQARDILRENLAITRQLEDQRGIAIALTNLGLVAQHRGEYKEAERLHRQGLHLHKKLQNRYLECLSLNALSFAQSWAGNFLQARENASLGLEIDRDAGNIPNLWRFIALAQASLHLGHFEEAAALAEACLELAQQRDHPIEKGVALMLLGAVNFVERNLDASADKLEESAYLMASLRYVYQALPRANLALVARAQGDHKTAHQQLQSALRSGIAVRSTTPIMYCLPVAALLAADNGNPGRVVTLYSLAQQYGHIANSRWFAVAACRELEQVRASLPAEVSAAAEARGRALDVWQTAETLLAELQSGSFAC
ncbi:MAG: tetratricopeptide repeat protein [Candidatus Promineifilaceae bacterium]